MNGSRAATLSTRAASFSLRWGLGAFRGEGFPMVPIAILATVAFVALFADVLAPSNPEVGTLG
jgi:hypothetical protein